MGLWTVRGKESKVLVKFFRNPKSRTACYSHRFCIPNMAILCRLHNIFSSQRDCATWLPRPNVWTPASLEVWAGSRMGPLSSVRNRSRFNRKGYPLTSKCQVYHWTGTSRWMWQMLMGGLGKLDSCKVSNLKGTTVSMTVPSLKESESHWTRMFSHSFNCAKGGKISELYPSGWAPKHVGTKRYPLISSDRWRDWACHHPTSTMQDHQRSNSPLRFPGRP